MSVNQVNSGEYRPSLHPLLAGRGGLMFKNGDTSWKKIVEVPDELKNGVIELARRQFADYANGMSAPGGSNEYSDLLREYRLSLPENERASAMWTLIFEKEEDAV